MVYRTDTFKQEMQAGRAAGGGVSAPVRIDAVERLGKYDVGMYQTLRKGAEAELDAHHVGQKALMRQFIPSYDPATGPSILVPKVGHTIGGPNGIVSRTMEGFDNARQVVARDVLELRRVYPDIPASKLQELIQLNKAMYPQVRKSP